MHRDADLPQVIAALAASRGFAGRLHGGQQEPDEPTDDRDHDEQFDKRETITKTRSI
jgi:hypothetical protein